jgi:uncharacterized protein involved in outer membrane biogenesis
LVTLNDVEISPTDGIGALRGFRMTNPKGFAEGDAFKFNEISVTLDVASIFSDPVVINEIVIDKPEITYAIGDGSSNMDEIQKNVNDYAGAQGGGSGDSGGGGGSSEGPNLIIENLYMRDGTVSVSAPGMTDETLTAPLPDIHLTDIGQEGRGATPAEVVSQTMDAIVASAKQAVQSVDVDALMKGAGEMAGEAQEKLEKATEGAGDAAGGAVDDATKGLKKLLE